MLRILGATLVALAVLAGAGLATALWLDRPDADPVVGTRHGSKGQDHGLIERGRYAVALADCAACHTAPGQGDFAGGRPIETPFGAVVAPNITPDLQTGIGAWTDAQFDAALRHGKTRDGRQLYPAMPYAYYTKMSRNDIEAIRAYLDTVPPVRNQVVADQLPWPLSIRSAMLAWNALYFSDAPFKPDPNKSAVWNRGAYLVEGPGHCGACHTPKTILGGDERSQNLQGNQIQGWFAPDITNDDARGLGRWSVRDVVDYLRTGHNRITGATGPMGEEIARSSSLTSDADLVATATYLKSLPGRGASDRPQPLAADSSVMRAGGAIYRDVCSACHAIDGHGVPHLFPDLAQSSALRAPDASTLIRIVLQGARSVATPTEPTAAGMPSFGWQLDDTQVAAVLTYVRNSWGASAPAVEADAVHRARLSLAARNE